MTDLISSVKIQQKLSPSNSRRVCIQQNRSAVSPVPPKTDQNQQLISSAFLLSNTSIITSLSNFYEPQTPAITPLSSILMSIQQVSPKPSIKAQNTSTATTAKSVRFNMPLTRTLHFYTPPAIDDEDDECYSGDDYDENEEVEEEEENKLEDAFLESFSKRLTSSSPQATDFASNLFHPAIQQHILDSTSTNKLNLVLLNWPSLHPPRYMMQMVRLENLSWENAHGIIKGRIIVCNLAYEKKVMIRVSFDHWKNWSDINATYNESFNDGALDLFEFELKPTSFISSNSQCSLAVRYQVNDREFWDNNSGNNFNLQWADSSCGNNSKLGDKQEKMAINVNSTIASKNQVNSLNSLGQSTTKALSRIGYQEEMNNRKREEYTIPLRHTQSISDFRLYHTTPRNSNNQGSILDSIFSSSPTTTTQQQISAHFQLYLDRKRRSEARQQQQEEHNMHNQSILTASTVAAITTPSQQIISPNRSEVMLLI